MGHPLELDSSSLPIFATLSLHFCHTSSHFLSSLVSSAHLSDPTRLINIHSQVSNKIKMFHALQNSPTSSKNVSKTTLIGLLIDLTNDN